MEQSPITPFDNMTQTRQLQMLKAVVPYIKSSQKKQFAILIKYMEMQNTLQVFSQEDKVMSMCSIDSADESPALSMMNALRPFCTEKELENIDMITNILSMIELYSNY